MHAPTAAPPDDNYVLNRDATEYERLRAQARAWEPATSRLFDQVALGPGARCLDAGCGPGLTMRLMAERVGPSGHVTGVDVDAGVGDEALRPPHVRRDAPARDDAGVEARGVVRVQRLAS